MSKYSVLHWSEMIKIAALKFQMITSWCSRFQRQAGRQDNGDITRDAVSRDWATFLDIRRPSDNMPIPANLLMHASVPNKNRLSRKNLPSSRLHRNSSALEMRREHVNRFKSCRLNPSPTSSLQKRGSSELRRGKSVRIMSFPSLIEVSHEESNSKTTAKETNNNNYRHHQHKIPTEEDEEKRLTNGLMELENFWKREVQLAASRSQKKVTPTRHCAVVENGTDLVHGVQRNED